VTASLKQALQKLKEQISKQESQEADSESDVVKPGTMCNNNSCTTVSQTN